MSDAAKCPKCDGRGVLSYHLNIDNGRCFLCCGAGTLTVRTMNAQKALKFQAVMSLRVFFHDHDDSAVTTVDWQRNAPYYESWARKAAEDLLAVGDREWCKAQLARLGGYAQRQICDAGRVLKGAA